MIYIPTLTTELRFEIKESYDNLLYSPNKNLPIKIKGNNITIWDNHTYYLKNMLKDQDKAYEHYIWFIGFVKNNWEEGITVITPDVDWLKKGEEIEDKWIQECYMYPQLYVPNTLQNPDKLNIVGYALRRGQEDIIHENWTHCLGHKRELDCKLLTYDSVKVL